MGSALYHQQKPLCHGSKCSSSFLPGFTLHTVKLGVKSKQQEAGESTGLAAALHHPKKCHSHRHL